ncbi:hypothetical protein [Phormidesmis priestleyi]
MRTSFSQALKIFFSPETILPFFFGSVFLAVLGNAVYDILKNLLGAETPALLRIGLGSLLVFFLSVTVVARIIAQKLAHLKHDRPEIFKRKPKKFRGLVLLVSNAQPCRQAIRFHLPRLQRCWLICSLQTLETAKEIAQEFPLVCQEDFIIINDIYDPIDFRDAVNEIYETKLLPTWQPSEVIADYVGMTAHGSVGMVLACIGTDRPLQYTPAHIDKTTQRIIGSLDPIEITLNWQPSHSRNQTKARKVI